MSDLLSLNETEFENLTFDMVCELGLRNCIWRTPGSDVGRDIEGEFYFSDVSGYFQKQKWYVECKRYASSVDWPTVWKKISYADVHDADVLLFVITSSLSPQAMDKLNEWNASKKRPILRVINGAEMINKLRLFPHVAIKYGLIASNDTNIAVSVFPLVKILLNAIYSLSSSIEVGLDVSAKVELSHALTDLITVRVKDLKQDNAVNSYSYVDYEDGYPWLVNGEILQDFALDKYGIRAVLSYLKWVAKKSTLEIGVDADGRVKISGIVVDDYQKEQLNAISSWSNFNVLFVDENVILYGG